MDLEDFINKIIQLNSEKLKHNYLQSYQRRLKKLSNN